MKKSTKKNQKVQNDSYLDGTISLPGTEYTFKEGFPTGSTDHLVYANSKLRRAIEAYKTFLPTLATEAVIQQMLVAEAVPNKQGIVMAQSPKQQFAATNSDTPYSLTILDLKEAGPMVIEMPPSQTLIGLVNDHNMRCIADIGSIGPEAGEGGKHLFLPPGYTGDVPGGYYVWQSRTWKFVPAIRTVPADGNVEKAIDLVEDIKVYPLSKAGEDVEHSYRRIDEENEELPLPLLDWEGTLEYWVQLHAVIQEENYQVEDRYTLGALAELGIAKGKPFEPNDEAIATLTKAAEIAHAELSISLYTNSDPDRIVWEGLLWEWSPLATLNRPIGDFGSSSAVNRDASDQYFFFGWGTSFGIGRREPGGGSIYYFAFRDSSEAYFTGGKNYKLSLPSPVPADMFWSVTVYDAETRCLIETDLNRAAVRSHLDNPELNAGGDAYDCYFGPEAPDEIPESNWVQTIDGKGWFTVVRLYGPKEEAFNKEWMLPDITELG